MLFSNMQLMISSCRKMKKMFFVKMRHMNIRTLMLKLIKKELYEMDDRVLMTINDRSVRLKEKSKHICYEELE